MTRATRGVRVVPLSRGRAGSTSASCPTDPRGSPCRGSSPTPWHRAQGTTNSDIRPWTAPQSAGRIMQEPQQPPLPIPEFDIVAGSRSPQIRHLGPHTDAPQDPTRRTRVASRCLSGACHARPSHSVEVGIGASPDEQCIRDATIAAGVFMRHARTTLFVRATPGAVSVKLWIFGVAWGGIDAGLAPKGCIRRGEVPAPPKKPSLRPATRQVPVSMAFVTDSNRPQPPWQPPPTASGAAPELPSLLNASLTQAVPADPHACLHIQ